MCKKYFKQIKATIQALVKQRFMEAHKELDKISKNQSAMDKLNYSERAMTQALQKYQRFDFDRNFPGAQVVSYQ